MIRFYDTFELAKRLPSGQFGKPETHKGRPFTRDADRVNRDGAVGLSEVFQLLTPVDCPVGIDDQVTIDGTRFYVAGPPEVLTVKGKPHHKRVTLNRTT